MMIIDIHAHLGYDYVFDEHQDEKQLIDAYDKYGVAGSIIQPYICRPYIDDTVKIHNRIYKFCRKYPDRFRGMMSIQPHFRPEDYEKEAERCCRDLGFVGIKISPIGHAVNPSGKDGFYVFKVAKKFNLPVMIHTGIGIPFADPVNAWGVIEAFPEVKVVIAHSGSSIMMRQALLLAEKFNNVYLETSWLPAPYTADIIKTIGAEKVMFATDSITNISIEVLKYKDLLGGSPDYDRVMSGTAKEVFNINIKE